MLPIFFNLINGRTLNNVTTSVYWLGRNVRQIGASSINFAVYVGNKIRNRALPCLEWSICKEHRSLSKFLVHVVADVNQPPGKHALTLLQYACTRKLHDVAAALINKGADLNVSSTIQERTALSCAVDQGDRQMIELLLKHGADINKKAHKKSLLLAALEGEKKEIAQLLLERNASPDEGEERHSDRGFTESSCTRESPLYNYVNGHYKFSFEKRMEYVKFLLQNRADPNKGHERIVEQFTTTTSFVEQMSFPERSDPNKVSLSKTINTTTPLYYALDQGMRGNDQNIASIITLLLDAGADPNKGDMEIDPKQNRHRTPLSKAVENNLTECVRLLLNKGALPNYVAFEKDDPQWPLFIAVKEQRTEIVKLLLGRGADAQANGQKLIWFARHNQEIISLLKQHGAVDQGGPEPSFCVWSKAG